jgi:hypothetical protein
MQSKNFILLHLNFSFSLELLYVMCDITEVQDAYKYYQADNNYLELSNKQQLIQNLDNVDRSSW